MGELVDVPLFELPGARRCRRNEPEPVKPLPPLPPPGDLEALRAYLAQMPPPQPRPRDDTIPPLHIPMPPPLAPGELSEEARKATWTALMKVGHWLDTWPQDCYQPRYFAALLQDLAYDVLHAKDRHFPPARTLSPRARREMEAGRG